ncbi:hypothetical protein [Streptomyces europaeiscabiei]|uniref:hypothetical protein n=1 Tax=Streptomyces europaeiscabiei TaxID=146819 RepID=UPI0029AE0E71|nr:hypothetical protein [Streptomyces europaeiscabiei]MDX3589075.1 hypothetical protein [Streptomyces europaeiscabiei]
MSDARVPFDDPDWQAKVTKSVGTPLGRVRLDRLLNTPADLERRAERLDKILLGMLVGFILAVIVLALYALNSVKHEPDVADVYGTLALVASGGVVGAFVLLRMHRARMRRDEGPSA